MLVHRGSGGRARNLSDNNRLHDVQHIAPPGVCQTRTFVAMKEVVDGAPLDFRPERGVTGFEPPAPASRREAPDATVSPEEMEVFG